MPERGRYGGQKKYQKRITTGSPPTVTENTQSTTYQPTHPPTHPRTHRHTHQAIHTSTMYYYSSTAVTYSSSRCVPSSYAALRGRVVKAPWVQKTKLQNTSTTHSHERTRPPTHTNTDPTTHRRTNLPTHDVLQRYSSTYSSTCVCTCRVYPCVVVLGFPFFSIIRHTPGSKRPVPGRSPLHAPHSPSRASAPVLSRGT